MEVGEEALNKIAKKLNMVINLNRLRSRII